MELRPDNGTEQRIRVGSHPDGALKKKQRFSDATVFPSGWLLRKTGGFNMLKKMKKNGGFTLIEMLIVVAIIAILVMVSIPVVSSSLEKAREATDTANERAAKAEILIEYLTGDNFSVDTPYYFDATAGKIEKVGSSTPSVKYGQCKEHKDGYITVEVNDEGKVTIAWDGVTNTKTHLIDGI